MLQRYTPNAFLAMRLIVVLATLLLGRAAGFASILVTAGSTLVVSLSHHYGLIACVADWQLYSDSASFAAMTRVTMIFVFVAVTFVVGISYVVARGEELALQKMQSRSALQREQVEKSSLWSELVERDEALEGLNRTLEDRGETRTRQLSEANQSLAREMQRRDYRSKIGCGTTFFLRIPIEGAKLGNGPSSHGLVVQA